MISSKAHQLAHLLICPRSKASLEYINIGNDEALLCHSTGVLYPIIDGIVVMKPITKELKDLCQGFLKKNSNFLGGLNDRFSMQGTLQALLIEEGTTNHHWEEEEMSYWEDFYVHQLNNFDLHKNNWNRTLSRKRMLDRLPISLPSKNVLEIGCGGATTLFEVYGGSISNYIGLDLSFYACKLAKKRFPGGFFIQGSTESMPFRESCVDIVAAFGVLHHLPTHEEHLRQILSILKMEGFFIASDPILKPRISTIWHRSINKNKVPTVVKKTGPAIGASPHNEWIDWNNLLYLIRGQATVFYARFEYGPLRAVFIKWLYDGAGFQSKLFTKIVIALDSLWLTTVGKLIRSIGPAGVVYSLQRNQMKEEVT